MRHTASCLKGIIGKVVGFAAGVEFAHAAIDGVGARGDGCRKGLRSACGGKQLRVGGGCEMCAARGGIHDCHAALFT